MRFERSLQGKFVATIVSVLVASLFIGCGKKDDDDDDDEEVANQPAGGATQNSDTLPDAPQLVLDLFKDDSDIAPAELTGAGTDCLEIDAQATFSDAVEPWPAELKAFLASELAKFPEFDLVTGAVAGIYLAKPEMLTLADAPPGTGVAGIMCGVANDKKGYVFINYQEYVTNRLARGPLQNYQPLTGVVDPHVLTEHGDQAVYTLVHEIFHAFDLAYFSSTNGSSAQVAGRNDVYELAWDDAGESLDPRVEIFARRALATGHVCTGRGFNLSPETADEFADAYRQLAEETNFISPYAQSNYAEDFADTLATWYFKAVYDEGLVRTVYSNDLTTTPVDPAQEIYKFDTKAILKGSAGHRNKMCAMVDLVFADQDCAAQVTN